MSQLVVTDPTYKRILEDPELARARSKLSFHEIRLIVNHVRATEAEKAGCPICSPAAPRLGEAGHLLCEKHARQRRSTGVA